MRISKDLGENYSMHSVDYTLSYKGRWHVSIPQIGLTFMLIESVNVITTWLI